MDQCVSWEKEGDLSIPAHYQHEKKYISYQSQSRNYALFRITAHSYDQVAKLQTVHKSFSGHVVGWERQDDFDYIHFCRAFSSPLPLPKQVLAVYVPTLPNKIRALALSLDEPISFPHNFQ